MPVVGCAVGFNVVGSGLGIPVGCAVIVGELDVVGVFVRGVSGGSDGAGEGNMVGYNVVGKTEGYTRVGKDVGPCSLGDSREARTKLKMRSPTRHKDAIIVIIKHHFFSFTGAVFFKKISLAHPRIFLASLCIFHLLSLATFIYTSFFRTKEVLQ